MILKSLSWLVSKLDLLCLLVYYLHSSQVPTYMHEVNWSFKIYISYAGGTPKLKGLKIGQS